MARVLSYPQTELQSDATLLTFPEKLWWIVNDPKHDEIQWDAQGTSIIIPSTQRFVGEILNNPSSALFKTKNFASFVRQLNLYGFRKVTEYPRRTACSTLSMSSRCEFKHTCFRKGRRDLLLHVKRKLYTAKKTVERQQRNHTPPPKEKHSAKHHGSASFHASWNPTLYAPLPFVPWQAPLQMPFTLYAPFCNPYQLAQMQQGLTPGVPNSQAPGLPGHFQPGPMNPSLLGTQNFGSCEGGAASSPPTGSNDTIHSQAAIQGESAETVTSLHSSSSINSTGTATVALPNSAPNAVITSNASLATASMTSACVKTHTGLIANKTVASQSNSDASAALNSEQGRRSSIRRESAEVCFAGSRPFAAHVLNKEANESAGFGSQSALSLKQNEDSFNTSVLDLCQRKELTSVRPE